MKRYYAIEIVTVALVMWCITLNIKLSNTISEVEILQAEVRAIGFDLTAVDFRLNKMQQEKDDFNNLNFSEAFKVMYDIYGTHHLFEWRGRVYTTDLKELRNITITPEENERD